MKKTRFLSRLLVLAMVAGILQPFALAYPVPDYGPQDPTMKFANGIPMSVSHRADWRNYPENTLLAIQSNIGMGIDVSELDVKLTKDGVVVLSHDSSISRCTGVNKNISDITWEELRTYPVKEGQGSGKPLYSLTEADAALLKNLSHYAEHVGAEPEAGGTMPVTRLDDAIELIDKRCMINLDHCFSQELFVACYVLFRENDMLDHVFFKNSVNVSTINGWYTAAASAWNTAHPDEEITDKDVQDSILYVYIHSRGDTNTQVLQEHLDNGDNLVMVEICISNDALHAGMMEILEPYCMRHGLAMFVNTMWANLCGSWPDTQTTWARMLDRGYVAIQTDRPGELSVYLNTINSPRKATDVIEAEHISSFSYDEADLENDDFGFSISDSHDGDLNKYVENMESGDHLVYRDIDFDGDEGMVLVTAKALAEDSTIAIYLDSLEPGGRVASLSPSVSRGYEEYTLELTQPVASGKHTVYIEARGLPNAALFSLDSFRFLGGDSFQGEAEVQAVSVTTQPGVEPQLPGSVQVTYGQNTYGFRVEWGPISAGKYAQEGVFSVSGYVPMLQDYITAEITVQAIAPGISQEGLALWLDASDGVTADGSGTVTQWASKVGDITATKSAGSPKLVERAAGEGAGIRFNGSSALALTMPEDFWNNKQDFTVILYNSPECVTSGAESGRNGQYNSVLYFGESNDWGSAYFTPSQNEIIFRFGSGVSNDYGTTYVRPANVGTAYGCTAIRKAGYDNTVFVDGLQVHAGTAQSDTAKNISSTGWIGLGKEGKYHTGTVCEILIYDRALSDEEIAAAQLYLRDKYAAVIDSVEPVQVTCNVGKAPALPQQVRVNYTNGQSGVLGVSWENIHPRHYQAAGSFPVSGTLSNGHSVTATVTVEDPFVTPFDQSRLLLWFSAQKGVTADESGKVTRWTGQVGSSDSLAATQITEDKMPAVVKGANDKVVGVRFDGTDDVLTFDNTLDAEFFNGRSGMTAVIYSKPEAAAPTKIGSNHFNSLLYINEFGGNRGWSGLYLGTYTNGMAGRFGTGTTENRGVLYQKGSYAGPTTTVLIKDGSTDKVLIDGTVISSADIDKSTGTPGSTTGNINAKDGKLGEGKVNSGKTTPWTGEVSEIMIFDHALTDAELGLVYTYLNDTYGAGLTVSQPEPPSDGLIFWMDASEGVTTDSSGKVTSWTSKGGESANATAKVGAALVRDSAPGSKPAVVFKDSVLQMPLSSEVFNGHSGMTAVVYAASETPLGTDKSDKGWLSQRNTTFYVDEDSSKGGWGSVFVGVYTDTISARFGTGKANDNGFYGAMRDPVTDFTTTTVRWNGAGDKAYHVTVDGNAFGADKPGTTQGSSTNNNKNIVYLGTGKDNRYWSGMVGDILLYNRVLTDQELGDIQSYLTLKYAATPGSGEGPVAVTGIFLQEEGTQLALHIGDTRQLDATVVPMDAEEQGLTWSSSDDSVVTVSPSGLITAVGTGSAAIVVTSVESGFQAYCTVKVTKSEQEVLWDAIQSVKAWAENQNTGLYTNWDAVMAQPLAAIATVTASSSVEALTEVYNALDEAILRLEKAPNAVTVTFNSMGGSIIREQVLAQGTAATQPQAPTKSGYTFTGWFTDEGCTQAYNFSSPVNGDLTLYAGWQEIPTTPDPGSGSGSGSGSHNSHTHRWSDWRITREPGRNYPGERSRICHECGRVDIEVIPPRGAEEEPPQVAEPLPNPYTDIADADWYYEAVMFATENGIMKCLGGKDSFQPHVNTTRAMFVNALFRMDGGVTDPELEKFYDMENTSGAVAWGSKNKIVNGCDDGSFQPDLEITREQMVSFLYRYAAFKGYDTSLSGDLKSFPDHDRVSDWAAEAMSWAVGSGLIQGTGSGINPQGLATRAEAAAVMMRFVQIFQSAK